MVMENKLSPSMFTRRLDFYLIFTCFETVQIIYQILKIVETLPKFIVLLVKNIQEWQCLSCFEHCDRGGNHWCKHQHILLDLYCYQVTRKRGADQYFYRLPFTGCMLQIHHWQGYCGSFYLQMLGMWLWEHYPKGFL